MENFFLLFGFLTAVPFTFSCVATDPGSAAPRTTTTRPPVTTTAFAQTTTTTRAGTNRFIIQVERITFFYFWVLYEKFFSRLETPDPASGCLRLTAICTAQAGFFAFMEFNVIEGGPAENQNMGQVR
ncbi:unnamed protein product [Strongylus vulgaris]|uniref:Uncharacterized protein n=1 Tax=Strongylus vulgaris TaxID=40348 RepID=A0A3P7J0T3_STRVU|nr:unnamed protein product [Strongylus vulgaris]